MFPLSDSIHASKFSFINYLLIIVTGYVFFKEITAASPDVFIQQFALIPSQINFTDFSTLFPFVSAIFLHGGWLHILSNMWFLFVFGDDVEGYFGHFFYLVIYLLFGIAGNVVQYLFMPHSSVPLLGASGAIAGVLGAYFVLFPYSKIKTLVPIFFFVTILEIPAPFMLGYWFVLQILSGAATLPLMSSTGGTAFFAHVGGFVAGILAGSIVRVKKATAE